MNPQEAKSKIELEAIAAVKNAFGKGPFTYPVSYCELYEQGAYFIFNVLSKEISEKDEKIKNLSDYCIKIGDSLIKTDQWLKDAKNEIERLKQEIITKKMRDNL